MIFKNLYFKISFINIMEYQDFYGFENFQKCSKLRNIIIKIFNEFNFEIWRIFIQIYYYLLYIFRLVYLFGIDVKFYYKEQCVLQLFVMGLRE